MFFLTFIIATAIFSHTFFLSFRFKEFCVFYCLLNLVCCVYLGSVLAFIVN